MYLACCLNTSGLKFMSFQSSPGERILPDSTHFFHITSMVVLQAPIKNTSSRTRDILEKYGSSRIYSKAL